MRLKLRLMAIICCLSSSILSQTSLSGRVTEEATEEPVLFGSVSLYNAEKSLIATQTNLSGQYHFSNLKPGEYEMRISYVGFITLVIKDIMLNPNQSKILDITLEAFPNTGCGIISNPEAILLFKTSNTVQGRNLFEHEISKSPYMELSELIKNSFY